MKINCIIEIPKDSNIKYEYDIKTENIFVDRIISGGFCYPQNYGFIPDTLDYDGDPLDVLVISDSIFSPGVQVNIRIVGVMMMIDKGEIDNKLLAVVVGDNKNNYIKKLADINNKILFDIEYFFMNYKKMENKVVQINGFKDLSMAKKILSETQALYCKFVDQIRNINKEELKKLIKK